MTFTHETPKGLTENLSRFQVVDLLWRNCPDYYLSNGEDTFSVWDAREAIEENIILEVIPTADPRGKAVAKVTNETKRWW